VSVPRSGSDQWERHWRDYAQSAEANPAQSYRRRLIAVTGNVKLPDYGRSKFPHLERMGEVLAPL